MALCKSPLCQTPKTDFPYKERSEDKDFCVPCYERGVPTACCGCGADLGVTGIDQLGSLDAAFAASDRGEGAPAGVLAFRLLWSEAASSMRRGWPGVHEFACWSCSRANAVASRRRRTEAAALKQEEARRKRLGLMECPRCRGTGTFRWSHRLGGQRCQGECFACDGAGEVPRHVCSGCFGKGAVEWLNPQGVRVATTCWTCSGTGC